MNGLGSDLTSSEVATEISLLNSGIQAVTGKMPSILRYPVCKLLNIYYSMARETRKL
jgi:hypothetical protein